MTAFTWRAADGTTGRLTGRAAEIVEIFTIDGEEWTHRQHHDGRGLQAIIHGASIGTEDLAAKAQLTALRDAMIGPVTLEREGEG